MIYDTFSHDDQLVKIQYFTKLHINSLLKKCY